MPKHDDRRALKPIPAFAESLVVPKKIWDELRLVVSPPLGKGGEVIDSVFSDVRRTDLRALTATNEQIALMSSALDDGDTAYCLFRPNKDGLGREIVPTREIDVASLPFEIDTLGCHPDGESERITVSISYRHRGAPVHTEFRYVREDEVFDVQQIVPPRHLNRTDGSTPEYLIVASISDDAAENIRRLELDWACGSSSAFEELVRSSRALASRETADWLGPVLKYRSQAVDPALHPHRFRPPRPFQ